MREEEKLYEKLLGKIEDRSSPEYKRLYRKLYYCRHRREIKEYQKKYYRNMKKKKDYLPPTNGVKYAEEFKIIYKPITLTFE